MDFVRYTEQANHGTKRNQSESVRLESTEYLKTFISNNQLIGEITY